jgi:tricarballylate dehydrogenase
VWHRSSTQQTISTEPDLLVIGGGNAGLCAAITARELGAKVVLLERAPSPWRGGNSKYARNIRCVHDEDPIMPGRYTLHEFESDLAAVTGDGSDPRLTAIAIGESAAAARWMEAHGIRWQAPLRGTLARILQERV